MRDMTADEMKRYLNAFIVVSSNIDGKSFGKICFTYYCRCLYSCTLGDVVLTANTCNSTVITLFSLALGVWCSLRAARW